MQKEDLPAGTCQGTVLEDQYRIVIVDLIQSSRCRETSFVDFSRPEITSDREQMRVSENGLERRPQI
jgi:hypothetical protein